MKNMRMLFMVLSIVGAHQLLASADQKNTNASRSSLADFFDEFDKIFNHTVDSIDLSRASFEDVVVKGAEDALKKIREQSRQMQQLATDGLCSLHQSSSTTISNVLEQTHKAMQKSIETFGTLIADMDQEIAKSKKFAQFQVKEFTDVERNIYGLKIMLPECDKDNIKVMFNRQDDKRIGIKKSLEVTAEQTSKKVLPGAKISQKMSSTTVINGRQRAINLENGTVVIKVDLPSYIDDEQYTMTFNDNWLVLEFSKDGNDEQRKSLNFTGEK